MDLRFWKNDRISRYNGIDGELQDPETGCCLPMGVRKSMQTIVSFK
jgi:hypothetical protein